MFLPRVGNMQRRINTRFTRQVYGNITYDAYAPTMSRNAWLSAVLGHQLFNEEVSLSYVGVKVTDPTRRVPPPVLQRLMALERGVKQLDVDAVRQSFQANKSELAELRKLVHNQRPQSSNARVDLLTGRRGEADRRRVQVDRNRRSDGRPVAEKIAEKAEELRSLGVVVSHRTLKLVGFGSDVVRRYLRQA